MCQIFEGHAQCKSSRKNDGQDIPRLQSILSRVEGMNNIVEVGHTENVREDRAVRKLILSTCM